MENTFLGSQPTRTRITGDHRVGRHPHRAPPGASRVATTPWPAAAQMLITPRPLPSSLSCLARPATIRPPVAANGGGAATPPPPVEGTGGAPAGEPPLTLSLERSIGPSGFLRPSFSAQNSLSS